MTFHIIVARGKLAEICGEYLTKGERVYIEGSIRTGNWKDREANERKSFDIVARYMQMLSSSANGDGAKAQPRQPNHPPGPSEDENPFGHDSQDEKVPF